MSPFTNRWGCGANYCRILPLSLVFAIGCTSALKGTLFSKSNDAGLVSLERRVDDETRRRWPEQNREQQTHETATVGLFKTKQATRDSENTAKVTSQKTGTFSSSANDSHSSTQFKWQAAPEDTHPTGVRGVVSVKKSHSRDEQFDSESSHAESRNTSKIASPANATVSSSIPLRPKYKSPSVESSDSDDANASEVTSTRAPIARANQIESRSLFSDSTAVRLPSASTRRVSDRITQTGFQPSQETAIPNEIPRAPVQPRETNPIHIPLEGSDVSKDVQVTVRNGRVSLATRNAPVQSILNLLAQQHGINLIISDDVLANISINLSDVTFEDALSSIVAIAGCTWTEQKGIVLVTKTGSGPGASPEVTGKMVEVFPLNFIAAEDIEATVKGLLSPTGQVFVTQTNPMDKRRTHEQVVVEDTPASLNRIAQYIARADQPPRQVMIEAHILQVELKDDTRNGINWKYVTEVAGSDVGIASVGLANPLASPASFFSIDGAHLDLVVEALKTTSDAKSLASPKVIVANGQESRIQIGQKLGYFVTTTTQTSTLQNVNFLNTGVVLRVTPLISNDDRVLMSVRPEVSTGKISSAGLPETQTTEAETTVLMSNGGGMIIGGLIKETDIETQDKIPILGDLWLIGRAFQRRSTARERSEIVIVLIPRIAPYEPQYAEAEQADVDKAQVRLFQGALNEEHRPWEPKLPDAVENPRRLRFSRLRAMFNNPKYENPKPIEYYVPTADEEYAPTPVPYGAPTLQPSPGNYEYAPQGLRPEDDPGIIKLQPAPSAAKSVNSPPRLTNRF